MSRRIEADAFERRVRPIYDALDGRQFKNSLKLANAALLKYPSNNLLSGLKAIALQRMHKDEEANKLCDEIVAAGPTDEGSLHPLMIVLKDLLRFQDITHLYEKACERDPSNVDLQRSLFSSYVRESNPAKQQQVAMKLLKLQPTATAGYSRDAGSYLWWVVISIVLQARNSFRGGFASMDPLKLVQLAESMITRQAGKDGKLESFEALLVYVDILLAQGKTQLALDSVSGALGAAATMPEERTHLHAVLNMMMGQLPGAAALLEGLLVGNPDDWTSLLLYMDCMMPASAASADSGAVGAGDGATSLQPNSSLLRLSGGLARELMHVLPPAGSSTDYSTDVITPPDAAAGREAVCVLLDKLVVAVEKPSESGARQLTMRGPHLGKVELSRRAVLCKLTSDQELAEAILAYYCHQGHLVSCPTDLRVYTSQLGAEASAWLASQLHAHTSATYLGVGASEGEEKGSQEKLKALRREVCAHQLLDDLGLPQFSSGSSAVEHALTLMRRYVAVQPMYSGLDDRERGPADELPILAAGSLMTAAAMSLSDADAVPHIMTALLMLRATVATRPYSAAMRLNATALYTLLGCPAGAHTQSQTLEMKNIQMDSLAGHHVLPAMLAFGNHAASAPATPPAANAILAPASRSDHATAVLHDMVALFVDHHRDAGDTLSKAYKCGSYSKVLEFVAFRERMQAAHSRALAKAESSLMPVYNAALTQDLDATVAALAIACAALPISDAPTHAAVDASSSSPPSPSPSQQQQDKVVPSASCGLRFNEDLSTRPAWYPPSVAACYLAPAEWWGDRAAWLGQGYGRRWWSSANSAESSCPEALSMRASKVGAARRRWLLPHLLAGALDVASASTSGSETKAPAVLPLAESLSLLAASLAVQPEVLADEKLYCQLAVTADVAADSAGPMPSPADLDMLHLYMFAAAASLDAELVVAFGGLPLLSPSSCTAAVRLSALQRLLASLAQHLSHALGLDGGGLLPGSSYNVASVFIVEHMQMLLMAMTAWSRHIKLRRKKKGATPTEDLPPLISCLASLQQCVVGSCQAVADALASCVPTNKAAVTKRTEAAVATVATTGALWEWQPKVELTKAVEEMVEEQQQTGTQLIAMLSKQLKAANALSFA